MNISLFSCNPVPKIHALDSDVKEEGKRRLSLKVMITNRALNKALRISGRNIIYKLTKLNLKLTQEITNRT
jgi:hypothetical protein